MENQWLKSDSEKANKEGWDLYSTIGSVDGPLQVQRNDEQGLLEDDEEAWLLVAKGTEKHHVKAKELLKKHNIIEYNRIINAAYLHCK